jgi:hypothetical protein
MFTLTGRSDGIMNKAERALAFQQTFSSIAPQLQPFKAPMLLKRVTTRIYKGQGYADNLINRFIIEGPLVYHSAAYVFRSRKRYQLPRHQARCRESES